jgi:acetyltransferase-like isoleucine patch superfamily enzyme
MATLYRRLVLSDSWGARNARALYHGIHNFSLPEISFFVRPLVFCFLFVREVYYFLCRVLIAEPFFRTYCTSIGKNFRTGAHRHWVMGRGNIEIGDNVVIDGKCNFFFALRYSENPTLRIGDNSGIGHSCSFTVGRGIYIGRNCRIASQITFFDTPGHPNDPVARLAGRPANLEDVRPITIGDNVWIGTNATIFPGVSIGNNSIVSFGSVVMSNVPENVLVAGNPARQIGKLTTAAVPEQPKPE